MTPFSIRTNTQALEAVTRLNQVHQQADIARQRVTTGLKIGAARDDVASFAIARGVQAQIAEFRGVRESLLTASAALSAASAAADQVHTLIDQARAHMLDLEAGQPDHTAALMKRQIIDLVDRAGAVVSQATFNGVNVLQGETYTLFTGQQSPPITVGGTDLMPRALDLDTSAGVATSAELAMPAEGEPEAEDSEPEISPYQLLPPVGGDPGTPDPTGVAPPEAVLPLSHISPVTPVTGSRPAHVGSYKWGGTVGTGLTLTYSFYEAGVSQYDFSVSGFELADDQKDSIRTALDAWSAVSGLTLMEVQDTPTTAGEIRFIWQSWRTSDTVSLLVSNHPAAGDVWLSATNFENQPVIPGNESYHIVNYLIGYALGLSVFSKTDQQDQIQWTVMSWKDYHGDASDGTSLRDFYPTTLMVNDIAAMQYMYGANMDHASGDTTYRWVEGEKILETIWDGGGTDTIDWSNQSTAAKISLQDGTYSELGPPIWAEDLWLQETLGIAFGAVIENAHGGSAADHITGNDADNQLAGHGGDDTLVGGIGNDTLDGGDGHDTAVFSGNFADYTIAKGEYGFTVSGADGDDTLWNVESAQFDDQTVLLSSLFPEEPEPEPEPEPAPPEPITLPKLDAALLSVTSTVGQLGAQIDAIERQAAAMESTIGALETGVGGLVDANLATESARLRSLEIRQELAIQALSVANSQPNVILSLFDTV